LGGPLREALEAIRRERVRGASWALREALRGALLEAEERGGLPCGAAGEIEAAAPWAAPLRLLSLLVARLCSEPDALTAALRGLLGHVEEAEARIAAAARGLLEDSRVATLSFSGTVARALVEARPRLVAVLVSRPGGEGLELARLLGGAGLRVEVLGDAAAFTAARMSDVAVLGADAILDECIVNKVGSGGLAASAALQGKPVAVLADATKALPGETCHGYPLGAARLEDGSAWSPVFEAVPWRAVSTLVTEYGSLTPRPGVAASLRGMLLEELGAVR